MAYFGNLEQPTSLDIEAQIEVVTVEIVVGGLVQPWLERVCHYAGSRMSIWKDRLEVQQGPYPIAGSVYHGRSVK